MKKAVCQKCGKEYEYYPAASRGKYCSRICAYEDYSTIAKTNHARYPESWRKVNDKTLLDGWEALKTGQYKTLTEMSTALGYGNKCLPGHLRKLISPNEYKLVMAYLKNRRKRQYTEEEVRKWFDKWLTSKRPLRELVGDGIPCFHTVGKLFKQFFPVEYEDAVERKNGKGYQIGRAFEYRCRDALKKLGYVVFRSPRSLSAADLVAMRQGVIILVQCKTRKDSFKQTERTALKEMANSAGGIALLAWRGRRRTGITWETLDGVVYQLS